MSRSLLAPLLLVLLLVSPTLSAELEVPSVFSDHAVLQRGVAVPIWGRGEPGSTVTVQFGPHEVSTQVEESGAWRVDLPALEASDLGRSLHIRSGEEHIVCEDVLVGEVWVCSGQSNMEWWKGVIVKRNVQDGYYEPEFVSLERLRDVYGK